MFLNNHDCARYAIMFYTINLIFSYCRCIKAWNGSMKSTTDFSIGQWNCWSNDVILAPIDTIAANCRCSRSWSIEFAVGARHRKQCHINADANGTTSDSKRPHRLKITQTPIVHFYQALFINYPRDSYSIFSSASMSPDFMYLNVCLRISHDKQDRKSVV